MSTFLWLAVFLLFLLVEACTVGVVSLWFAAGGLAAMIASILGAEFWLQGVLFLAVSCILLACLRPVVRKYFKPRLAKTNVDAVINTQGYITIAVDNLKAEGQVKLGGMDWTARSADGQNIPAGTLVRVDRIEGVKVFVTPVE